MLLLLINLSKALSLSIISWLLLHWAILYRWTQCLSTGQGQWSTKPRGNIKQYREDRGQDGCVFTAHAHPSTLCWWIAPIATYINRRPPCTVSYHFLKREVFSIDYFILWNYDWTISFAITFHLNWFSTLYNPYLFKESPDKKQILVSPIGILSYQPYSVQRALTPSLCLSLESREACNQAGCGIYPTNLCTEDWLLKSYS